MKRLTYDLKRRASVVTLAGNARAHLRQWFDDSVHGPLLYGGVPGESAWEILSGKNSGNQTGGSSTVAGIQSI